MARAVKGGEAEASDVSAPSLEGPGITLITMELAGRESAGLGADFLAWRTGRSPAWRAPERPGRRSTGGACVWSEFLALSAMA